METRTTSGYFSGFSILSLVFGGGFMCVCLILGWFTRQKAIIVFAVAMFFGGVANCLACRVLDRMEEAGYEVGYWCWSTKDLKLYSEYRRIAPNKWWSRLTLSGALLCFLLAAVFYPIFARNVFGRSANTVIVNHPLWCCGMNPVKTRSLQTALDPTNR